jgi:hypothetical protein
MSFCKCHEYVDENDGPFCFDCSHGICEGCGNVDELDKYNAFIKIRKRVYKDDKRPKILKFLSTIWKSSRDPVNQYDYYVKEKKIKKLKRIQKIDKIDKADEIKVINDSGFDSESSCDIDSDTDSSVYSSIDDGYNDGFMIICDDCTTKKNNEVEYEKIKLENENNKLEYEKIKLENENNKLEYEKIKRENENNKIEYEKIKLEIDNKKLAIMYTNLLLTKS